MNNRLNWRNLVGLLCINVLLQYVIHVPKHDTIKGSVFCTFVGNRNVFYYYWSVSNDLVSRAVPICCQFCHLITKLTIDGFLRTLNTIEWSHVFVIWNNGLRLIFPYVQNVLYPPSLLDRLQIFKLVHRCYLLKYRRLAIAVTKTCMSY